MRALSTMLALVPAVASYAADLPVPGAFATIQAAIDAAADGDRIIVASGTYVEDIAFAGKAIEVVGEGADTVLRGTGMGSVVTFAAGEGPASVLDGFTITGGSAPVGGGIRVSSASPTIRRNVIRENGAQTRGSGIFVEGAAAAPHIHNNLIVYNRHTAGDPHAIQVQDASPVIENNTIVRNDSNGILLAGGGTPLVVNNILAWNGSYVEDAGKRGRGICDFTPGSIVRYNLFFRNRVAALLRGGTDYRRVRVAQAVLEDPDLVGNVDGNPQLARRRPARTAEEATLSDFAPLAVATSPIAGAGDPDPAYANADGGRNTIGHTGGPFGTAF